MTLAELKGDFVEMRGLAETCREKYNETKDVYYSRAELFFRVEAWFIYKTISEIEERILTKKGR